MGIKVPILVPPNKRVVHLDPRSIEIPLELVLDSGAFGVQSVIESIAFVSQRQQKE